MSKTAFISSKPKGWVTPFPTIGEVVRGVANVLETKGNSPKDYGRLARGELLGHEELERLWNDAFNLPSELRFGKIQEVVDDVRENMLAEYIHILSDDHRPYNYSIEHVTDCLSRKVGGIVYYLIGTILEGQDELLRKCIISDKPLSIAFKHNKDTWENFRKNPPHGKGVDAAKTTESIYRWMKGEQTPDMRTLLDVIAIFCDSTSAEVDNIYRVFFCAKIIGNIAQYKPLLDALRYFANHKIIGYSNEPFAVTLHNLHGDTFSTQENIASVEKYFTQYNRAVKELQNCKNKDKEKINKLLENLENITTGLQNINICWWNTQHLRAYWYVLSGEWECAKECYEEIMDIIFYSGAHHARIIFMEALVLAAIQKDRPFLKKLKHLGVIFELFEKPYTNNFNSEYTCANKESRTKDFVVEDSEVNSWASKFYELFPKDSFFISVDKLPNAVENPAFLHYIDGDMPQKADLKNVKKKIIKLGLNEYPQLVWFTLKRNIQLVKELLAAGADVNKLSSCNESALLLAIREMDITVVPGPPPEERNIEFFDILSRYEHKKETLEALTNKRHLSILGAAVETGNPNIVSKVLEMMKCVDANVDIKFGGDDTTPLYRAIVLFKEADIFTNQRRDISPETFEYLRRTNAPCAGITTEQTMRNYAKMTNNPHYMQVTHWTSQILRALYQIAYKRENLLKIIDALLKAGSNPNEPHCVWGGELRGYTPLMMAAENDFVEAFDLLIKHGGNVEQEFECIHKVTSELKKRTCWHIVLDWKSDNVLEYMKKNCKGGKRVII